MNWRFIARSAAAALTALVLAFVLAQPAAQAQRLPTNVLVRGASMRALERLYEPGVEIITQGSWNKASGYNDPRFQQMIGGASDHDMRVFMPSPAGQTAAEAAAFRERATKVWRRYRDLVDEELNRLVQAGVLRAEELNVVRRSINVYPPEQLMAGVNSSEDAIARFQELRTRPNLIDASDDAARGAYGEMQKFARQEFETGERVRVITASGGRARFTALSDLNHMIEGYGARRPLGLAFAATNNLDDALHALEANARNLKDVAKYTDRASRYMAEARDKLRLTPPRSGVPPTGAADKLRVPLPQDDTAFGQLSKKLTAMKDKFDAAEPKLGVADAITGNRVPRAKTAEEIATQNQILAEMQSMGDEIRRALRVATEESLILQNMARAIEEGQPVVARFYRLLMSGSGKWVGTLASMRDQMASINERAKKIGYLNIVSALYEFYSFPWNYEKEGTTMASVRLAKGLATLAVPELAIGELLGLIATGISEYAVDEVKAFGYSAVASRQDCLDLIAGHYSVYGREVQVLGVGTKTCHASPSLRQLACDVYDTGDLRGTIARGGRPDARSIPSQLRGMIECHAENASYRSDETKSSDKGVQDFLVNRCVQDVLPKWLQERDVVLGEVSMITDAIANVSLSASFDPEQAIIRDPAKGTTVTVTASIEPAYQDAIGLLKGDVSKGGLQCAGSKVARPFVYERVVWRQDGKEVDSGTRVGSRQFEFPKAGSSTVCVDWELEYGVIGAPTALTPEEMSGKIRKTACTTIDAMVDVGVEKITAKITGPKKAAAPEKAETGKALSFAAELATKRDPKAFRYAWNFPDGNLQTQADVPEPKVIWYRPGRFEISLDVFDGADFGTVSDIKPKPVAQAKHAITVESSLADARNDGKVTVAISGPAEIKVGGAADLSASVQAPEHLKAKIRQLYWYLWRMGGPDEDPSEIGFQGYELLGEGPTLRWTPPSAGDFTILARVMGESIAGEVAGASHRLHVTCREEGGNTVCQGPKTAPRKLGVIVLPDRRSVATGDQVLVNAIASGGKPPFSFAWSPAVDGDGPAVTYRPTAAAPALTVTATDATGASAKETVTFGVDRALPLLEGLAATETFGTSRALTAALEGGRSIQWQSSPNLAFDKPESADGRGQVTFTRLGRVKVWGDVMVPKDGTLSKLGSTDPVEVDVVAPASRVAFEPATSRPGAEVSARVELTPAPDPAQVYYVWTQPSTTQREEVSPGTIRFKAGDKPTAIEVEVRARASDQTVAQLSARFDPTGAATTSGGGGPDAGGAPSKAKQAAELLAKAKAAVAAGQLDEGIAGAGEAARTDPSLAEAATLGAQWQAERQTVTRQVAASDAALAAGRIPDAKKQLAVAQAAHPKYRPVVEAAQRIAQREAERARQVQSLVAAAQAALAKGDVDAAAASAQTAAQLDPAAAAQVINQVSYEAKKQGWAAVNDRDFARAIPRLELATRFAPADADARDRLAQAKRFAATWPQVEAKAREFDALVAALKPFSAYEAMLQMQNLQHDMPSGMGNPLSRRVMEASNRALAEYNVFWQAKTDEHRRTFVEQDWDAMLKNARETLARELSPASVNEARSRLAFAEQQLAGQKEALDYAAQIRSALAAGQLGDPQRVLGELRTRAGRFKAQDARGQPVRDTIAALERHQRVLAAKGYAAVKFASGDRMLAAYDYVTAAGEYAAGLKALRENGDPADPDIAKYERKRQDAEARAQRIATLMPRIAPIAMDPGLPAKATLEQAFGEADEVVRLQPTNTDAQIYRNRIADKLKQHEAQAQARANAAALWNDGRRLYEGGDALGALAKFKESLRAWPDEANQRYVADLEARIGQARAAAAALWNEGRALYDAGRPREALAKFKDSLRAWPDAANARYVEQLEAALAAQAAAQAAGPRPVVPAPVVPPAASPPGTVPPGAVPPTTPPPVAAPAGTTPQGSPAAPGSADAGFFLVDLTPVGGKKGAARTVKGLRVDDGSWVRLKATNEKRLALDVPLAQRVGASAIAVVSNLDNAHYLKDGFLTTVLTVHTTAGDRTFEFRAGVHSSEWNRSETGGADHAYPKSTAIGDARWMAVFALPAGTVVTGLRFDHRDTDPKLYHMGAAPGFCLRGITLVTGASLPAEAAAAASASMAGTGGGTSPSGPATGAPSGPATGTPPGTAAGGLLAHYPLDGNAQDASGRGLHGKVTGAQPTTDRTGRAGGAMLFDGRGFIELPLDVNPSVVPRLTFTAWVRADAPAPIQQVMSHDDGGFDRSLGIDGRGGGVGWSLFAGTSGVVGFRPAQKGQWVFVAAVWDQPAGKVRLQVDDWVVERPGSLGGGGRTLNLGRNPGFGEHFVGAIDDVRLYGDALAASQLAQVRAGAAPSSVAAPAATAGPAAPSGNVVFDNGNIGGVGNAPTRPTTFTLPAARTITMIRTYHWNNGRGAAPGSVGLRDAAGRTYGPWPVTATPGQGGAPNVNWIARPNVPLPPGTYTVIDSDPSTWSQNGESGGAGFVHVESAP